MSETLLQRPTPVPQSPAREIINVDDFILSDDDVQIVPRAGRRVIQRGPQEIIVVYDSDDDIQEVSGGPAGIHNPPGRGRRGTPRIRRRALFSPSPPPQNNIIPPVPPLPPYARDPPLRWRAIQDFAGVFRPLERPLAFEEGLAVPRRTPDVRRRQRNRVGGNEAPRHPNMGLGGALYALNHQNQWEAPPRASGGAVQAANVNRFNWGITSLGAGIDAGFGMLRRFLNFGPGTPEPVISEDEEDAALLEALAFDADEHQNPQFRLFHPNRGRTHIRRFMRHEDVLQRRQITPDYKQLFTHPEKPEPGFANEFAPHDPIIISDESGPSSASPTETGTILVCAQCLDPLLLNVIGSEDVVRRSRLWGLRCGHILDGKCIDALMRPPPLPPVQLIAEQMDVDTSPPPNKWKGKGNTEKKYIVDKVSSGKYTFAVHDNPAMDQAASSERKGKRKASVLEEDASVLPVTTPQTDKKGKGRAYPSIPISTPATIADVPETQEQGEEPSVQLGSICSRRRPRHLVTQIGSSLDSVIEPHEVRAHDAIIPEEPNPFVPSTSPTRSQHRGNGRGRGRGRRSRGGGTKDRVRGKGKVKAKAPIIEAEHFWFCPVASCTRKHKSVLIEDEWCMDGEQGAIAMYV